MDSFGSGYLPYLCTLFWCRSNYVPLTTAFPPCNLQSYMYIISALCAHSSTTKSAYTTNLTSSTIIRCFEFLCTAVHVTSRRACVDSNKPRKDDSSNLGALIVGGAMDNVRTSYAGNQKDRLYDDLPKLFFLA